MQRAEILTYQVTLAFFSLVYLYPRKIWIHTLQVKLKCQIRLGLLQVSKGGCESIQNSGLLYYPQIQIFRIFSLKSLLPIKYR
jgi:hypothetical protein